MKPRRGIAAGQHILLDAEGGNIKAVDHILRGENHLDVAAHGDVKFVDLALTFLVLQLPHPLLGDDIDFGRASGRRALLEVNHRAPNKDNEENEQWNHRPGDFQRGRAFDLFRWTPRRRRYCTANTMIGREDGHAHHRRQMTRKINSASTLPAVSRGACGPKWKSIKHNQSSVFSPLSSASTATGVGRTLLSAAFDFDS